MQQRVGGGRQRASTCQVQISNLFNVSLAAILNLHSLRVERALIYVESCSNLVDRLICQFNFLCVTHSPPSRPFVPHPSCSTACL